MVVVVIMGAGIVVGVTTDDRFETGHFGEAPAPLLVRRRFSGGKTLRILEKGNGSWPNTDAIRDVTCNK